VATKQAPKFDPTKSHDPIIGHTSKGAGKQAAKERKDMVEDLAILLQNTLEDRVSGMQFLSKVDLVGNYLHTLRTYAESLKTAAQGIQDAHPEGQNEPLEALVSLSDVLLEGARMSEQYLDAVKQFATDLNNIRTEINTQVSNLHWEL